METDERFRPFIRRLNELEKVPDAEIERILPLLTPRLIVKGDFFVRAGEVARTIAFMASGLLRYYYIAPDGKESVRYFCEGNSFVSSFTSVMTGRPSLYAIQAIEPTELFVMDAADYFALSKAHVVWGLITQKVQSQALLLAERREGSLVTLSAKDRYLQFLEDYPGLEARVRQYDIASYLGITPVALSRIRSSKAVEKGRKLN